jgi:hypothetical protein
MLTRVEPAPDRELIVSITPDVMKCLERSSFFDRLDDLLCPRDDSHHREDCCGDYKLSESILRTSGFEPSEFADIFAVLRAKGGFCDCEILYNASESNRLKAKYWRGRTERAEPRRSHAPRPPVDPK